MKRSYDLSDCLICSILGYFFGGATIVSVFFLWEYCRSAKTDYLIFCIVFGMLAIFICIIIICTLLSKKKMKDEDCTQKKE